MSEDRSARLAALLVVIAAFGLASCDDASTARPNCPSNPPVVPADLTQPAVSFRNDVHSELSRTCGDFLCHGSRQGYNQGIFIGQDLDLTYAAMVNVPADQLRSMNYATPGDPSKSYLLLKLDSQQCTMNDRCIDGYCGERMPKGQVEMPLAKRDVIRRWIAQGCQKN